MRAEVSWISMTNNLFYFHDWDSSRCVCLWINKCVCVANFWIGTAYKENDASWILFIMKCPFSTEPDNATTKLNHLPMYKAAPTNRDFVIAASSLFQKWFATCVES